MPQSATSLAPPAGADEHSDPLRAALEEANIPTLLMVLSHLTGDDRWISDPYTVQRSKGIGDNDTAGLSKERQAEVRDAAYEVTLAHREGRLEVPTISVDRVALLLAAGLGEDVDPEYGSLLAEELGLVSRDVDLSNVPIPTGFGVVIIGTGFSGLAVAIKLKAAGVPFTMLEKNLTVGGTWHENRYPGCGVDTPSHFYSFSFAASAHWLRYFTKREQLAAYLEQLADDHGIREHIRFGVEVEGASYDASSASWLVSVRDGAGATETVTSSVLVTAVGVVNRPSIPEIPGMQRFTGPLMHTAQWQDGTVLAGKRVAVIGTGASAMQLVPSIVDETRRVLVFQRSKQWAVPHPNYHRDVHEATRLVMQEVPHYAGWYRLRAFWNFSDRLYPSLQIDPTWPHQDRSINADNDAQREFLTRYIQRELGERQDLLEDCVPDYPPYGKRMLLDNGWFRTVARDDVELITEGVAEIREHSLVDSAGVEHEVDVIVLATGFKALQFLWPMTITGADGTTLRETWGEEDARAYLGQTVPGFPNLFIVNGPNTNAGHGGSAVIAIELQVRYLLQALRHLLCEGGGSIEVRQEAFDRYNVELDEALSHLIWNHPGMTTYYRNSAGRIVTTSPWTYLESWKRTLQLATEDFVVR